jgi:fructoselysine-6-P-deglycase FrlB-like protein
MTELWVNVFAGENIEESLYTNTDFVASALDFAKPFTASDRFARYFYLGSGARYGIAAEAVLNEMKTLGATTLSIGTNADADYRLPEKSYHVHNMPILQALAIHRAVGKGLDPDQPRHLEQVVRLQAKDFLGGSQ